MASSRRGWSSGCKGRGPEGWFRALDADGGLPDELALSEEERAEWTGLLTADGVAMVFGRADPGKRVPGTDLRQLVGDGILGESPRRAWLVRGSSVQGANLVRDLWLPQGLCSLPASRLRELPLAPPRTWSGQPWTRTTRMPPCKSGRG